jgi:hypothetical protein
VRAAAKSLVNYFRDVCPQMLPKKLVGRFTKIEAKEMPIYGAQHLATTVDGIDLLKEGANLASERFLTDGDLKRIKLIKMKHAAKHVDRKRFRDSDSSEGEDGGEGGEDEFSELDESGEGEEMGEDEISASVSSEQAKKLVKMAGKSSNVKK